MKVVQGFPSIRWKTLPFLHFWWEILNIYSWWVPFCYFPADTRQNNTVYSNELLWWLSGWGPVTPQQQHASGNFVVINRGGVTRLFLDLTGWDVHDWGHEICTQSQRAELWFPKHETKEKQWRISDSLTPMWCGHYYAAWTRFTSQNMPREFFLWGCRQCYNLHSEHLHHPQGTMYICSQILTCTPSAWAEEWFVFMFTSATLIKYVKPAV